MVRARDWAAGLGLFLATAAVIWWQGTHLVVLWDFSYVLDMAARIAAGQMPYRDFPLVHTPGTFLVQAALIRLTGRVFWHTVVYISLIGGLGSVLAWRIALRILGGAWWLALAVSVPVVAVGVYCILPQPSYDCDTIFWVLVAVWAITRLDTRLDEPGAGLWPGFAAGIAATMPLWFKQNIGLPFLLMVVVSAIVLVFFGRREQRKALCGLLGGVGAAVFASILLLYFTAGIGNLLHWTVKFAGERRLPGMGAMIGMYCDPQLLWTLPALGVGGWLASKPQTRLRAAGVLLIAAPFVWAFSILLRSSDADDRAASLLALWPMILLAAAAVAVARLVRERASLGLEEFLPLLILAAIHGTLLSQQLWGSTYSIFPLLVLLAAGVFAAMSGAGWPRMAVAAVFSVTLLVCGGFYTASEDRLSYADFPPGPLVRSGFAALAGMATSGPYVSDFDELLRYAEVNIPADDGVILLPGEDPFYFVTGRKPRFPVLLFDPATDPYTSVETAAEASRRDIRWLVVKRRLQIRESPAPDRAGLEEQLVREFHPVAHLAGYDIYRR